MRVYTGLCVNKSTYAFLDLASAIVQLQRPGPRVISHIGCAAKSAASPIRLMPVGPNRSFPLLFFIIRTKHISPMVEFHAKDETDGEHVAH